jgi:DNA-binding response OmpR family regulator
MTDSSKIEGVLESQFDPVLIVEDNRANQDLLAALCKKSNVEFELAENGQVALEKSKHKKYSIYIVDLMMPVVDGKTFINEINKFDQTPVILVQTALDSSETIIEIMKLGVYDYIIKPIDPRLFTRTLFKALEYKYLKDIELSQRLSAGDKIRSQIEWLNYKDNRRFTEENSSETKSIYSLKTSLAQGAGFGTLITMIDIMKQSAVQNGEFYTVEKPIVDMIIDNNEFCRTQLDGLNYATDIMEKDFTLEEHDTGYLLERIPQYIERIIPFFGEKNMKITYPEFKGTYTIKFNEEVISLVIEELVVNAYKYSTPNSTINIIAHISEGYFWLAVKNDVTEKPYGGIPKEYQKLVLEPFFRIHPPDESVAKVERIGFGLGLAVVDYVAKKHAGIFIIHDVKDFTRDSKKYCVMAELLLPIRR